MVCVLIADLLSQDRSNEMVPRRIGFLLLPGFSMGALGAAVDLLNVTGGVSREALYTSHSIGIDSAPVRSSTGLVLTPELSIDHASGFFLTFVVSTLEFADFYDERAAAWLRRQARHGTWIGALGSGAVFIAKTGLLDGYCCTTHWRLFGEFARQFPAVTLTRNLFCIDRDRLTCAGGTAVLDLILALIAQDHGQDRAAEAAELLLHTQIRSSTEGQRVSAQGRFDLTDKRLVRAITLMEQALERPASLPELARAAGMSNRQFQRLFSRVLGQSPARFYLELRLKHARMQLQRSSRSILDVALESGFSDASHFTRQYRLMFGETPGQARRNARPAEVDRHPGRPEPSLASEHQERAQSARKAEMG
ncbi:AraC family transcriptional regulator [Aliidongia dinghuensis]|uniref:AraC family transcriptional regulator n=1 Tax=Aliidongia dinghuensis TaxID=1867774 RepID=A0A8J3E2F3_9PROT|nr:GlxA family transcriptional regulator [Aliidongia dinghuensis]GGF10523.1 AraC family transcriptional regulator [Aliidongia dinghuensis]